MQKNNPANQNIAIVGMGCRYPDAENPRELWENVLSKRQAFRQFPAQRLNLDDYYPDNPEHPDSIYLRQAAVLNHYHFDRVAYRISGKAYRSSDLSHWLALDVAAQTLADAGFAQGAGLDKQRTGVLLGNTLTGEFSRANLMRLRWPYVRRVIDIQLKMEQRTEQQRQQFLTELELLYKAPFPEPDDETLSGGLSNTIAGRICNYFDFGGGGYTLDGACSSSLLAVSNASRSLMCNELDAVLVGGVDLSLDPFELVGFSRLGAFAKDKMNVYDQHSTGFLPGEGCGFLLLMRYDDALAMGARCYALIKGCGISSDGSGGLTRPEQSGQQLAIQRAYQCAGYDINEVALFEGHGTGTLIGDNVEIGALVAEGQESSAAVLSSIKSNIGHTKAAAGAAGLIKAVMALHTQVLPPATGVNTAHHKISNSDLQLLSQAQLWDKNRALRAGVSSFGFGGINVHIALEGTATQRRQQLTEQDSKFRRAEQDCELFLFSAADKKELIQQIEKIALIAAQLSYAELTDLAAKLSQSLSAQGFRAAVVATDAQQLAQRLEYLLAQLNTANDKVFSQPQAVYFSNSTIAPKITLLFPGQASPVRLQGGTFSRSFDIVEDLYQSAELSAGSSRDTDIAQPAIVSSELAGLLLLEHFAIDAHQAVGMSLGELTALYWAGAIERSDLLALVKKRGQLMAQDKGLATGMLSLVCDRKVAETLLDNESELTIAGFNNNRQTIISGAASALQQLLQRAQQSGISAIPLNVNQAFHSPFMKSIGVEFADYLQQFSFSAVQNKVRSTITGAELEEQQDIADLLVQQLTRPVLFQQAFEQSSSETDIYLEVGAGKSLSGIAIDLTDKPVFSLDVGADSFQPLLNTLAGLYCAGSTIDTTALFRDRFFRDFDLDNPFEFLTNPCEEVPDLSLKPVVLPTEARIEQPAIIVDNDDSDILQYMQKLTAQYAELPFAEIHPDSCFLSDLHLNSITVGQLVNEAAKHFNIRVPMAAAEFADASVQQLATALDTLEQTIGEEQQPDIVPGLDAWIRCFTIDYKPLTLPVVSREPESGSGWKIHTEDNCLYKQALAKALIAFGSGGCILCLTSQQSHEQISSLLLSVAQEFLNSQQTGYFVLLQNGSDASAFARTFYLENPAIRVCVVHISDDEQAVSCLLAELALSRDYHEVFYNTQGQRSERRVNVLAPVTTAEPRLSSDDVLLISGGAKGIAAECALQLAKRYQLKLLLLGRSDVQDDKELANNLARFKAAQCQFYYIKSDVNNADAVRKAVAEGEKQLAPVTMLMHSAGLNKPMLIKQLTIELMNATLKPKVNGLENLLAAVNKEKLRYLIGFGSIIAETGMPGEAHYGLANQWLAQLGKEFQGQYPDCKTLLMEWSVWSGAGMGERLGSVESLAQQGITAISINQGVDILVKQLAQPHKEPVIVSGRLPDSPTLKLGIPELPFYRFLEKIAVYFPAIELIAQFDLSPGSDPYLADHVLQGQFILPAVCGIEAMAQVAQALQQTDQYPVFKNINLLLPVVVNQDQAESIQIASLRTEDKISLAIRCQQTDFKQDYFTAECIFDSAAVEHALLPEYDNLPVALNTEDLYGFMLFHTGRFRCIKQYRYLQSKTCCVDIETSNKNTWFAGYLPQQLALGSPAARDAAIHAIQACIPHARLLPVSIEKLTIVHTQISGRSILYARERWQRDKRFCYDLQVFSETGVLSEVWQGLELQQIEDLVWQQWSAPLLANYLARQANSVLLNSIDYLALRYDPETPAQQRSEYAVLEALGKKTEILKRSDGKPEIAGHQLSCSHSGDYTLAVLSQNLIACDIELVNNSMAVESLGSIDIKMQEHLVDHYHDSPLVAALRLWTVQECLKKAELPLSTPLTIDNNTSSDCLLFTAGDHLLISYLAEFNNSQQLVISLFLTHKED